MIRCNECGKEEIDEETALMMLWAHELIKDIWLCPKCFVKARCKK